ncbi:MAG TPA: class I SAM-dependent methyltransferase, partial [Thermomicrobiales bacterium]|nr:class I SAM-dependent methyltransferase [Thermomicrobiales bacterium]
MGVQKDVDRTLTEQREYYRARAPEYDQWFLRKGRYDQGPELNQRWFDEVEEVRAALDATRIAGDVLEMAAGTGWWTERLAATAEHLTALDASPETL